MLRSDLMDEGAGPPLPMRNRVDPDSGLRTTNPLTKRRRPLWIRQYVGIDFHRRRSVIVRMSAATHHSHVASRRCRASWRRDHSSANTVDQSSFTMITVQPSASARARDSSAPAVKANSRSASSWFTRSGVPPECLSPTTRVATLGRVPKVPLGDASYLPVRLGMCR
jgi:hypothetical protein